jgi:hypothetical protein
MMIIGILTSVLSLAGQPLSASECTLQHVSAVPGCDAIGQFAQCLATASAGKDLLAAEVFLAQAQEKVRAP